MLKSTNNFVSNIMTKTGCISKPAPPVSGVEGGLTPLVPAPPAPPPLAVPPAA